MALLVDVALPIPLFRTFTYEVNGEAAHPVTTGSRVVVPFRQRKEIGIVVGEGKPRAGVARRGALPAALSGAAAPEPSVKTRRVVVLARELPSLLRRGGIFARAPQQRALFELLEALGGRAPVEHLLAQRGAIDALTAAGPGEAFLLHGVTGSGKTLVYIELLRHVVEGRGRSAIVLVPEIALTPQTVDRFRAVFGDRIAVLHSALSDGERYDAWLALRRGEKRIAVGARSAVFAPVPDLGAIVVDEEHEGSYKQGEAPRYHARELAIVRARHDGAVVVLGSATPSLESWVNAHAGKYRLLRLPDRVGGARLPAVQAVDLRSSRGPV